MSSDTEAVRAFADVLRASFQKRSAAAGMDALLLAQARWRDDHTAEYIIAKHCDPAEVNRVLAGWLRTAVQKALEYGAGAEMDDHDELDVVARWISGEPTP